MAKENCEVCGKEVGMLGKIKLGDNSTICKDCRKKAIVWFEPMDNSLTNYNEHIRQLANGEKLFNAYFGKKNKKKDILLNGKVMTDKATGLICFINKTGGFLGFGGTLQTVVYRLADLEIYELETRKEKDSQGQEVETYKAHFFFRNVEGLCELRLATNKQAYETMKRNIDGIFSNFGINFLKSRAQKQKDEMALAASIAGNMKKALSGDDVAMAEGAAGLAQNVGDSFYVNRKELVQKADAAIQAVLGN